MYPLTHHYLFGGLAIDSAVELGGARCVPPGAEGHPVRFFLHRGDAPPADRTLFAWPGRYALTLGLIGDHWRFGSRFDGTFVTDPAVSRIDCHATESFLTPAAMDVLTRRVLPRLAIATGALTVHSAALSRDGGAILMFGPSGAGKSTLTAALARDGWSIASDDLTIVRDGADGPMIHPGATGVCLWPDTRNALALDPARCFTMPGYEDKLRFEPEAAPGAEPAPLRAVVLLDRSDTVTTPRLAKLPIRDAIRAASGQIIALDPTASRTPLLNALLQTMARVPTVKLSYPSGYGTLPAVTELLATLL